MPPYQVRRIYPELTLALVEDVAKLIDVVHVELTAMYRYTTINARMQGWIFIESEHKWFWSIAS